jgi:hypothetical protein
MKHFGVDWPKWLPEPDWGLSPLTGWSRAHWLSLADSMLVAVRTHASPGHARVNLPGPEGGYGRLVDGLEGFARTFLLAGFRLAGDPSDPLGLADWYAAGLAAGSDPAGRERWVRPNEHSQAKVEAASIALMLDLTRDQIWSRLDDSTQQHLVDYFAPVVGDPNYGRNNWRWFRVVVETFLRSVGGPWSVEDIAEDLAIHDSFARAGGWMTDGSGRAFDHYVDWALHYYPTLWQRMTGAKELASDERRTRYRQALDRYLVDARHLVGADGGPLIQGRSLIYRFAAAAPYWVGALAGVESTSPGALRRAASGIGRHFVDHGAPGPDGLLSLGWHGPWPSLAQSYSGPGSPYWAGKGFLGLALQPTHPVWTAVEEPLPVERSDFVRVIAAPGWVAHARASDGLVQVSNHGTDHARPGDRLADSPLYARLGYSTATAPLLNWSAWTSPFEQSACLVDAAGRASHRTGFRLVRMSSHDHGTAIAVSTGLLRWVTPKPTQRSSGNGLAGRTRLAGRMTVVSLVRSAWEIRGVHLVDVAHHGRGGVRGLRLRVAGWAVVGERERERERERVLSQVSRRCQPAD